MRKFSNETNGIREQKWKIMHNNLAHRGIQRCEEFILRKDITLGQHVHDGALTHVGVPHQSHTYKRSTITSLRRHLLVDLLQLLL